MDPILDPLNDKQREGVTQTEGAVLVIAGAGSGKTRMITHRFAYLMREKRLGLQNILAVTFTNKAAAEMKERIGSLTGRDATQAWVRTFHSMGALILRRNPEPVGLDRNFVIYDDQDSKNLVKSLMRDMNIGTDMFQPGAIAHSIARAKDDLIPPSSFQSDGEAYDGVLRKVYEAYEKSLRKNNAADFADLIGLTLKLFQENPAVLAYYQDIWQYAMVDEFQDTNRAQYDLMKTIVSHNENVCVVGDDDQSIYSWRGANVDHIFDFRDRYGAKVILLEQNYRSTGKILEAANGVVSNIHTRMEKKLWTDRAGGDPIRIVESDTDKAEAETIAGKIDDSLGNRKLRDFAIFYRTNAQSRALEEALLRKRIPYKIFGGQKFYERMEVKDVMAYVRVAINPYDRASFERIINVPKRGIGDAIRGRLVDYAESGNKTYIEALLEAETIPLVPSGAAKKCVDLGQILLELNQGVDKIPPTTFATVLIEAIEFKRYIREYDEAWEDRWQNVEELVSSIRIYELQNPGKTMIDFTNDITLQAEIDTMEADGERDYVSLMTIHNAKGLEFPVVFVSGVSDGLIPHYSSRGSGREEDEELRLFYVAMTRAKDSLYLTYPKVRMAYGELKTADASPYLDYLPAGLTEREFSRTRTAARSNPADYYAKKRIERPVKTVEFEPAMFGAKDDRHESFGEDDAITVGQKVFHRTFGTGKVLFVSNHLVKIEFEDGKTQALGGNFRYSLQKVKE